VVSFSSVAAQPGQQGSSAARRSKQHGTQCGHGRLHSARSCMTAVRCQAPSSTGWSWCRARGCLGRSSCPPARPAPPPPPPLHPPPAQISVNRSPPPGQKAPTGSAYVTYMRDEDAARCISVIDNVVWDGGWRRAAGWPPRFRPPPAACCPQSVGCVGRRRPAARARQWAAHGRVALGLPAARAASSWLAAAKICQVGHVPSLPPLPPLPPPLPACRQAGQGHLRHHQVLQRLPQGRPLRQPRVPLPARCW
jgi:hypothetical protein